MGSGSSMRRGGGRKLRALTRKFVFLGFRREESGMSRDFCRDVPDPWGCSKTLCKKSSCAFFVPYKGKGVFTLGRSYLRVSLFLLAVGLCCLRSIGLVFYTCGGNSA